MPPATPTVSPSVKTMVNPSQSAFVRNERRHTMRARVPHDYAELLGTQGH